MPKYVWNETQARLNAGAVNPGFGRLFDANGDELSESVTYCDTDTGEVWFMVKSMSGKHHVDHHSGVHVEAFAIFQAPLRFEPYDTNVPTIITSQG